MTEINTEKDAANVAKDFKYDCLCICSGIERFGCNGS